ncbi:MAG: BrnA antitoxin family protein [Spirochaetaceae bacterium]|jgi:uncharacterized protein (DUF4415 family)|nr:BrnA antitoxin family protein [Spirochaetaceae bacterium]
MSGDNTLTPEEIQNLKNRSVDLSDIPEITDEQAVLFKPRYFNVKPIKQTLSIRVDSDCVSWLKSPGTKGYQTRLNRVIRWAMEHGCPIKEI